MATSKLPVGVIGSGRGSNLRAILDACDRPEFPAQVVCVLSDVADSGCLQIARERKISNRHIPPGKYRTKLEPEIEVQYACALREAGVKLVVLAGYMRVVKEPLLREFAGRIINIHPSLLPAFRGLAAWKQALDAGAKTTGCTVHFVDDGMDTGPIILQAKVPVLTGDSAEGLHARIQKEEHRVYPEAIQLFAEGRLQIEGRTVKIRPCDNSR